MASNRKTRYLQQLRNEKQKNYKFLVIRNGLIGDTVFITPVLHKLKVEYPNSEVDVIINANSKEVLKNFSFINKIFSLPVEFSITKHVLFFLSLRKYKYDCVFVQEMNTHYTIMSKLLGAKLLLGYDNPVSNLYDFSVERKGHAVPAEQLLVNYLTRSDEVDQTILFTTPEEDSDARKLLIENGVNKNIVICIQFACSEKNSVREIPKNTIAALADELNNMNDVQVIFTGTKSEITEIEGIGTLMKTRLVSLAGKTTIRNLIAILKKAALVIGPDTGTLHIANAVGTPVIMCMGYSMPEDTGPYDKSNRSKVIQGNLECIPCVYTNPKPANWDYCSKNRPALCMAMIKPSDILEVVSSIIK